MFGAKYAKPVDINGTVRPICILSLSLCVILTKKHPLLWIEVEHRHVCFPLDPDTMIQIHRIWIKQFSRSDLPALALQEPNYFSPLQAAFRGVGGVRYRAVS